MLKFQNNNTTVIATFEDFILTTYVIIDELYHQFALPEVAKRRHVLDAKLSDSEIITISLCGELLTHRFWPVFFTVGTLECKKTDRLFLHFLHEFFANISFIC